MICFLIIISIYYQILINAQESLNKELILNQDTDNVYTSACNAYSYFEVKMIDPCLDLVISVTPSSGNPSIYVSKNNKKPKLTDLTWTETDSFNLTISHWDADSSPGTYYISVFGGCEYKNEPSVYKISAKTADNSDNDIYVHKNLTLNKYILAEEYLFFKFCLPSCANVTVKLQNCLSYDVCNDSYSYPELLVSRTEEFPQLHDYSFKLASVERREIFVNNKDPAARDPNGYNPGSYFVGVYGWCTPDELVIDPKVDGPCSYAAKTLFNVTVSFSDSTDSTECDTKSLVYDDFPSGMKELSSGEVADGYVACNEYVYYKIDVPNACSSLNIYVGNSSYDYSVPELAVSQWPNLKPTFDNIQYTSYNYVFQNLTISTFDPNFFGGNRCGSNKNDLCYTIIGVLGYCGDPSNQNPVHYTLTATISPAHKIYGVAQTKQKVDAGGTHSYEFCIPEDVNTASGATDTAAELLQYTSSCTCSDKNTRLEMTISPRKPRATVNELSWSITHYERTHAIMLLGENDDTRSGSLYGWCDDSASSSCKDTCSCAPCSHLSHSQYALKVSDEIPYSYADDLDEYLGYCSSGDDEEDSNGSSSSEDLSPGAIAGIVIGCIAGLLILCAIIYFCIIQPKKKRDYYSSAASELESETDSNVELVNLNKI